MESVRHTCNLGSEDLLLFCAREPLLDNSPILAFYGPSATGNSTQNTSRVQAYVYSWAGFQSFPRLTIAPNSPRYVAVHHLPDDLQGDEIARGLAVSILTYFASIPATTKQCLKEYARSLSSHGSPPVMFDEMHAAQIASNMIQIQKTTAIMKVLTASLIERKCPWLDVDMILPAGSITNTVLSKGNESCTDDDGLPPLEYGTFQSFIQSLGPATLLPSSDLQRAASKRITGSNRESLGRDGKIALRREMCELVDTESNYLTKLRDLVQRVAPDVRHFTSPELGRSLVPDSLNQILDANESFYQEIQSLLDLTEAAAIKDIESGDLDAHLQGPLNAQNPLLMDATGLCHFAQTFLHRFPDFKAPYGDFLKSSVQLHSAMAQFMSSESEEIRTYLSEIGEQHLRSALIEPVQRLPRYTLFIDNICHLIPARHVARPLLLRAREIISEVCALETNSHEKEKHLKTVLESRIRSWPRSLAYPGRVITAVDANEIDFPFDNIACQKPVIILLFPGNVVVLRGIQSDTLSARGLLAEIENTQSSSNRSPFDQEKGLEFAGHYPLGKTWLTNSADGNLMHLSELPSSDTIPSGKDATPIRAFHLQGPYRGKNARFAEEAAKANVEKRYPVNLRKHDRWSLRCMNATGDHMGFTFAITEVMDSLNIGNEDFLGKIRFYIDNRPPQKSLMAGNSGAMIVGHLMVCEDGASTLEVETLEGTRSCQQCKLEDAAHAFRSQVQQILRARELPSPQHHILLDLTFLDALPLESQPKSSKHRGLRPRSPVKMISSILGSINGSTLSPSKSRSRAATIEHTNSFVDLPLDLELQAPPDRGMIDDSPIKKIAGTVDGEGGQKSSLVLLEDTFSAYISALRSRSGNVVGKLLQTRKQTDELIVNELYNGLLENPERLETAAVSSVDILFSAFEKFLRVAWRERMGPIFPPELAKGILTKLETASPVDLLEHFKRCLEEMSPQNRRALAATLKLLSDLLDASSSDGDRGVLIASFTEALIFVGNPHDFIQLLDHLVDGYDGFFEDVVGTQGARVTDLSCSSQTRFSKNNSFSSTTSSLRRRFGIGGPSFREHGNTTDSKNASIWRALSKASRTQGETPSITSASKVSLARSRSTDTDVRGYPTFRPPSRERPNTSEPSLQSRAGTTGSHATGKDGLPDGKSMGNHAIRNRKRRSSLSDLQRPSSRKDSDHISPLESSRKKKQPITSPVKDREAPNKFLEPPALRKLQYQTLKEASSTPYLQSLETKENDPPDHPMPARSIMKGNDTVKITSFISTNSKSTLRDLPTTKTGLSERAWSSSDSNVQHQQHPKPQSKLRLQSPQKVRQRLNKGQQNAKFPDVVLQTELDSIGQELSHQDSANATSSQDLVILKDRLDRLQMQLKDQVTQQSYSSSLDTVDQRKKLAVAEKKIRSLDELYREANAENEALYERFNDELGKILARVKKGEGIEEMRARLRGSQEEVSRLRAENAKLRRKVAEVPCSDYD